MIRCPNVPATVMNTVLNMYLENGTHDSDIITNTSWKFFNVGLRTNNLGGNTNSSSTGFRELLMDSTSGTTMNTPSAIRINIFRKLPALEWLGLTPFLFLFAMSVAHLSQQLLYHRIAQHHCQEQERRDCGSISHLKPYGTVVDQM